ncbi:MAG TPA: S9 family peptidase, partial [Chitinophagaceae bacterium]|nr:S9 family peptidase [Chitinophagaceae bacterium]
FLSSILLAQKNASVSFEQWISLKNVGSPVISPDGNVIVYTTTTTDWAENAYDTELWMAKEGEVPIQLTRTSKGSSSNAAFTPDGKFISFIADRGNKRQIYLISVQGGEAMQLTKDEDGINNYAWNPDGARIVYSKTQPKSKKDKTKEERYGAFGIEGEEYQQTHLWILSFHYDSILMAGQFPCYSAKDSASKKSDCVSLPVAKVLTEGNFHVGNFAWSPDGKQIAFNRQRDPLINSGITSDIVLIDAGTKKMTTVISNPVGDFFSAWSPDGKAFVYSSTIDDSVSNYYKNNRLFIYDLSAKSSLEIAKDIDENKSVADWNKFGLFVTAFDKTSFRFYSVNVKTGATENIPLSIDLPGGIAFSKNADMVAASGRSYDGLSEIYRWKWGAAAKTITITNNTAQIKDWNTPVNEVIHWKSHDGAEIEGILLKPKNYDPKKKYPLLVVIHGGPTGIDLPDPVPAYVYPIMHWVEKGALVLRVNYRGSAGYGGKFRALNVRNLGVGDMWDVVSGVEFLAGKNMIDTSRMGCMGWSQGGYISAFLTTNTNMFKAISVGAGISNWVTYYVNTDITPFTRQYLQSTPWNDMDIYLKTSPMTNINKASTPTLIQHGEFDKRVPIPNAYELYRGLQDRGIPSKLIVYKGFGHGINKPKERLAAVWHNWQWFNQFVFREKEETMPLDDKF